MANQEPTQSMEERMFWRKRQRERKKSKIAKDKPLEKS